jgi:hypothetical protein
MDPDARERERECATHIEVATSVDGADRGEELYRRRDMLEAQLKCQQGRRSHAHLVTSGSVALQKTRLGRMRVWWRNCRVDTIRSIEVSLKYELATDKQLAWPHVCREVVVALSQVKMNVHSSTSYRFNPTVPFVLCHTMTARERKI